MTDQESSSSEEQASSAPNSDHHRFTLIAAVGIMGTEEDCTKFMELMIEDFQVRCHRANEKIMKGRIVILPVEETMPFEEDLPDNEGFGSVPGR